MAELTALTGDWRPDRSETLLAQAALLPDPVAAAAAWEAWRDAGGTFEALNGGTSFVAPLLHERFKDTNEPLLGRLRGVRRHAWIANQALRRALVAVLGILHAEQIPTLLLKGAALAHAVRADWSLRPMTDADVLVPTDRIDDALAALARSGWLPVDRFGGYTFPREWPGFRYLYQAVNVERGAPPRVDLHWHALGACALPWLDDALWRASTPTLLDGAPTAVPAPTDLLLHAVVHGARNDAPRHLHWAADAMALIELGVDWDRLDALARRARVRLQVAAALEWLCAALQAPIPAGRAAALAAGPPTLAEREYFAAISAHPVARRAWTDAPGPARVAARLWRRYRLHETMTTGPRALGRRGRVRDFALFCRYHLRLDHAGGLPAAVALALHREPATCTATD